MTSCETTRALASLLNVVTDRLAILCTSPINNHRTLGSDFTKIWPLSSIKVRKLKTVLDAIVTTKERPTRSSWARTINVATDTLLQSTVSDPDKELLQDTFGHVVILTNNGRGLSTDMLTHGTLQFHVICPTSVSLGEFDAVTCNGWKLRSIGDNQPQATKTCLKNDTAGLSHRLRQLVLHARSGRDASKLTYLSLDIKPGPGCRIQSIMGKNEYLALHPGENRTVLVRLTVSALSARGCPTACSENIPDLGPDSKDILHELGNMLNTAPTTTNLLTARLMYQHSSLPPGTICSVDADCTVSKRVADPVQGSCFEGPRTGQPAECTVVVHERLAHCLATSGSPRRAFTDFSSEFGEEGWCSYCPDYTHLVFKELKYQARIMERLEMENSPQKLIRPTTMDLSPSPTSIAEQTFDQGLDRTSSNRSEGCFTVVPIEEFPDPNSSQCTLMPIGDRNTNSAPRVKRNEAIISWGESDKTLKDRRHGPGGRAKSLTQREGMDGLREQVATMRRRKSESSPLAVIKKGSIGALRHITSTGETMGKGLGAA